MLDLFFLHYDEPVVWTLGIEDGYFVSHSLAKHGEGAACELVLHVLAVYAPIVFALGFPYVVCAVLDLRPIAAND